MWWVWVTYDIDGLRQQCETYFYLGSPLLSFDLADAGDNDGIPVKEPSSLMILKGP